ncbi:P-loop containing nucleoside triphosphate hydrolase protein [Mycena floridula]|nr:P-loop containing nucleoside triphosphate hydrolase protein [Mycena floridula]
MKTEPGAQYYYSPASSIKGGQVTITRCEEILKGIELLPDRLHAWNDGFESLKKVQVPNIKIGILGATGAGKSTLVNALLQMNILPTSGHRACTSAITVVTHHKKDTIVASITFLTEEEWSNEIKLSLDDCESESDGVRQIPKINSSSSLEVAESWQKIRDVYPRENFNTLAKMTVQELISSDENIRQVLGTTKVVSCATVEEFSKEIVKYIGPKKKDRRKGIVQEPVFWPLICQVKIECRSPILETGVVLIDLPGTSDTNAVRNNIAETFMKKCDFLWVVSPMSRASDEKAAWDLTNKALRRKLAFDGKCLSTMWYRISS